MSFKKNFIAIDNEFFDNTEKINWFSKIGTEGFTLYCYLLYKQSNNDECDIDLSNIQDYFNREYDKRPEVIYRKTTEKKNQVTTLKDKRTIKKYIEILEKNELITILTNNKNKYTLSCNKRNNNNFTAIPTELFKDYIHKIGHIGFSLLCLLSRLHNSNFGGVGCQGFANPTEIHIKSILKRNIETIRAYSYLLQKQKLIKVEVQKVVYKGETDKNGNVFEFESNHYIVKHKLVDDKYNLYNDN